jgi:hypothetical protein
MALFNDGPLSSLLDLQNAESGILNVASTEGIDLAGKMALAQVTIATELLVFLLRRQTLAYDMLWSMRRQRGTDDVIVTLPLKQWHVHKSLAMVYRDAYNNQLNDRYLNKWNEYETLAKASKETLLQIGVGLVADPLPKPSGPLLTAISGPGTAATYYIAMTWTNATGHESAPSDTTSISGLNGQQIVVAAANAPANATGWNMYAGQAPDGLGLQNSVPIAVGASVTLSAVQPGPSVGDGQKPTWFYVDHRVIERG